MGYNEDYNEDLYFEEFYPLPEYNPLGIEFPSGYIDKHHLISDKDIKEINKSVGIKNLVFVPREGYGGGDPIKEIFIGLGVDLFAATIFEPVKTACLKLIEKIKKNKPNDQFDFVFMIRNVEKGMFFEVRTNTEDSPEKAAELLEQTRRIAEIINKPLINDNKTNSDL